MHRQSLFSIIKNQYQLRVTHELEIYILKSLRDLLLLAIEFFIENAMGQVISTVDHNHIPLRDLGFEFLIQTDSSKISYIGYQMSVEELAIMWVLFCFINGSKGLTVVQKGVRCLTIARTLRMCLYTMTVLPSPKPWCRFNDPINPFKLRVGGACNDLLYSGHVTIYTLTAISFTILPRLYPSRLLRYGLPILVWFHIIQRIICTILERHHYSIDMFLGLVVTLLIWQCQPLHIDLPVVPHNLFLHLKQLFYPRFRSTLREV
jgi:hypothetical protein